MSSMFDDPRVASLITPEVRVYLETNMPWEGTEPDQQIGHWIGVTAGVLLELAAVSTQLGHAQQRIRELEADA